MSTENDNLVQLFERFRKRDDPAAFSKLFEQALTPVMRQVRGRYPTALESDLEDAVIIAFGELARKPERYDPSQSQFVTFVVVVAKRRLIDIWRKEGKDPSSYPEEVSEYMDTEDVVLGEISANTFIGKPITEIADPDADTEAEALRNIIFTGWDVSEIYRREVAEWLAGILPDARDRDLLRLAAQGQVIAEAFAGLYGLKDLSPEEVRKEMKRNRDRVEQRVKRNRESLRELLRRLDAE